MADTLSRVQQLSGKLEILLTSISQMGLCSIQLSGILKIKVTQAVQHGDMITGR